MAIAARAPEGLLLLTATRNAEHRGALIDLKPERRIPNAASRSALRSATAVGTHRATAAPMPPAIISRRPPTKWIEGTWVPVLRPRSRRGRPSAVQPVIGFRRTIRDPMPDRSAPAVPNAAPARQF
jgi:hypothetical protein